MRKIDRTLNPGVKKATCKITHACHPRRCGSQSLKTHHPPISRGGGNCSAARHPSARAAELARSHEHAAAVVRPAAPPRLLPLRELLDHALALHRRKPPRDRTERRAVRGVLRDAHILFWVGLGDYALTGSH